MTPPRYDRFGDPIDEDQDDNVLITRAAVRGHECRNGWVGEDDEGRPIPCDLCRAATVERRFRQRQRQEEWLT